MFPSIVLEQKKVGPVAKDDVDDVEGNEKQIKRYTMCAQNIRRKRGGEESERGRKNERGESERLK